MKLKEVHQIQARGVKVYKKRKKKKKEKQQKITAGLGREKTERRGDRQGRRVFMGPCTDTDVVVTRRPR